MSPVTTLPLLSPQQAKHRQRALGSLWNTPLSSLSREQRDHRKTLPTAGSIFQAPQDPRPKRPTAAVPSSAPGALERRSRPLAKPKREARRHEIGVACFDINHPLAVRQLQGDFKRRLDRAALVKAINDKAPSKQSAAFLIDYNAQARLDAASAVSSAKSLASST